MSGTSGQGLFTPVNQQIMVLTDIRFTAQRVCVCGGVCTKGGGMHAGLGWQIAANQSHADPRLLNTTVVDTHIILEWIHIWDACGMCPT